MEGLITQQAPQRTIRQPPERVRTPAGLWRMVAEYSLLAGVVVLILAVIPFAWWQETVITAAAALAGFTTVRAKAGELVVWTVCWTMLAAGWLAWARLTSPLSVTSLLALGTVLLVMVPPGVRAVARDMHAQASLDRLAASRDAARYLRRWTALFERIGVPGVEAIEETEHGNGRAVLLRLGAGCPVIFDRLHSHTGSLERAGRFPHNSVRFERADPKDASLVRMHVVERMFLGKPLPLPDLPATMTINDPLPVGLREDGQRASLLLRETATLVLGVRGAGKTNLANLLAALAGRCVDVIICLIDVDKGGRLATPWILPWIEGKAIRPAIDWIATTRDEAEVMLRALLAIREARSESGIGGSKIIPAASMPQILVLCDEMAGLFGQDFTRREGLSNAGFFKLGMDLTRLGRSEAIEPAWFTQRGTGSFTGGNDLKSQCDTRIGLGTATVAEALSAVPDDGYAARLMASLSAPGAALIERRGQRKPLPVMLYRLDPAETADLSRIERIAIENAMIRPDLDELSRNAAGEAWSKRWDNSSLYRKLAAERYPAETREPATAPARDTAIRPLPADTISAWNEMLARPDQLGGLSAGSMARPGAWKGRVVAMVSDPDRQMIGWSPAEIRHRLKAEGLGVARETLSRYLSELVDQGVTERHNGLYRLRRDQL